MFQATIRKLDAEDVLLKLQSESRRQMFYLRMLCDENHLLCEVTEEVKPRVVKFKGVV